MIDTSEEKTYSACELARLLKSQRGIERSHRTVLRWMKKGCRRKGRQIRLESLSVGGQFCSSMEAIDRFFERLSTTCPLCDAIGFSIRCEMCGYDRKESVE